MTRDEVTDTIMCRLASYAVVNNQPWDVFNVNLIFGPK